MYLAWGVYIVLLMTIFAVLRAAVGVLTSPGYFMRSPPTVRRVQFRSYFYGDVIHYYPAIGDVFASLG